MDTFEQCRNASERVSWNFEEELGDLHFDFGRRMLPRRLCGEHLPSWLGPEARHSLNHIRGFSYAHIFLFVEEFIIQQTCSSALGYVHEDNTALSAMLRFSEEETKHQRMFELMKDLFEQGLGHRPGELGDKEAVAKVVNAKSPFAVFLLTLALEWLTQRHYVECFQPQEADLDAGFVKVFRLHWTEEAQHARMDAVQLRRMVKTMSAAEISAALDEFMDLMATFKVLLAQQDELDLQSLETVMGEGFEREPREELLCALNREWLWTFLVSGLEHRSFERVFSDVVPSEMLTIAAVKKHLGWTDVPEPVVAVRPA